MFFLSKVLKEMAEEWNEHIISKSSYGPDAMCFLPDLLDCQDNSDPLEHENIDEFLLIVEEIPPNYSDEFCEFVEIIVTYEGLEMPVNVKSCLNLYLYLEFS